MPYIQFIGEDDKYRANVMPYKTQHGKQAVRIISEPLEPREVGFRYFNDSDQMLGDYIDYRHHYMDNVYTMEPDTFEPGGPGNGPIGSSALSRLESALGRLSVMTYQNTSEIQELTPYVETKTAYIDDTEIIFTDVPEGNVLISAINREGNSVHALYSREEDKVIVTFEPLEYVTDVTLTVQ